MKSQMNYIRKSDRVKFCSHDILQDLFDIYGPMALRISAYNSKKNRVKSKKHRSSKSYPKDLDGVLGLASFIREVENFEPESDRSFTSRAATHLNIARFIYNDLTGNS